MSCTCGSTGTKGCEQNSAILVGKEEEEKDGESVSQKAENDTDAEEEEESLNDKEAKKLDAEENNNEEDLGNILVAKEMISFHPSMEDLVELISESGVILNAQNSKFKNQNSKFKIKKSKFKIQKS